MIRTLDLRHSASRRRPLLLAWACRSLLGLGVALPWWSAVAASPLSQHPNGDATLFEPGGVYLVEFAVRISSQFGSLATFSAVALLFASLLFTFPLAAWLEALNADGPEPLGDSVGRGFRRVPAFVLLTGLCAVTQALLLFFATTFALSVPTSFGLTERSADLSALVVFGVGATLVLALGLLRDLAFCHAVAEDAPGLSALKGGALTFLRCFSSVWLGFATYVCWAVAVVLLGAWLVGVIDVSQGDLTRLFGVTAIHQLGLLLLLWLRGAWLSRALSLVHAR